MAYVRLLHWNATEAAGLTGRIRACGHTVDHCDAFGPGRFRQLRLSPPDAIVISLDRLPAHGREVAITLRQTKATRHIPIVFAGGAAAKVAAVRKILPDAVYAEWSNINTALRQAIARLLLQPVVPASKSGFNTGAPLTKKLGIVTNMTVGLLGAPPDFEATLGDLPEGARLLETWREPVGLLLWFLRSSAQLETDIDWVSSRAAGAPLWILWAKMTSETPSDLTQFSIRRVLNASGFVDSKSCAIDKTWSAMRFTRRRPAKAHRGR